MTFSCGNMTSQYENQNMPKNKTFLTTHAFVDTQWATWYMTSQNKLHFAVEIFFQTVTHAT